MTRRKPYVRPITVRERKGWEDDRDGSASTHYGRMGRIIVHKYLDYPGDYFVSVYGSYLTADRVRLSGATTLEAAKGQALQALVELANDLLVEVGRARDALVEKKP